MINLDVIILKENIIKTLNGSNIPITVKQLVLGEVQGIVNSLVVQALEHEKKLMKEGEKDGEEICEA